ncbi:MAG: helix-turn-helix domain-containing protein [Candidatus Marinimicrobia bacterium]|nr:helix-turn-helix domain-containing protein [Candidatus Neomarinimicrobiota bacterium]
MEQMYSLKSAALLLDIPVRELMSLCRRSGVSLYTVGDSTKIKAIGLKSLVILSASGSAEISQLLCLTRAANLLDISTKTLRRLLLSDNIPTYRVGSNIRLKVSDLALLIKPQKSLYDY